MREIISRLNYGSLALRPAALLALLSEQTGFSSSLRGRLRPGFRRFGHPPRRRISLQRQLGNLRCQDFHLLDQQLASLHYPANLCPIFCDGMASHSKPRTAILHNRDGHCKRFLSELGYPSREPTRTGLQRVSRVRMLERKEKMKAYPSDLTRFVQSKDLHQDWPD